MAENKRVTLHPLLPDGTPDQSVNLYPKTLESGIVSDATGEQVNLQHELVSGENIKTVFGSDLVGSGNVEADNNLNNVSERPVQNKVITEALSDKMSKTVAETVTGKKVFNDGIEATGVEADSVMSELIIVEDVLNLSTLNGGAHVNGKILPSIDSEFDIGSPTQKYHNAYISNVISDGTRSVKVNEIAKKSEVTAEIDSRLTGAYVIKGTKTVAEINAMDLSTLTIGWVYNVSDSGTINQGGIFVNPGDNIVWLGSDWDKLAGTVDFSNFVEKTSDINKVYGTDSYGNQTTISYGNEANGNTIVQRKGDGQITVLNSPIADSDAASKKYVDDSVEEVRAVAEGKCNTFVLGYGDDIEDVKSNIGGWQGKKAYLYLGYEKFDKQTPTDITNDVINGLYDGVTIRNSIFNSQASDLTLNPGVTYPNKSYLILEEGLNWLLVELSPTNNIIFANKGDIVLVKEVDVPDRWFASVGSANNSLYKLETSKVDLTNYYTKSETDSLLNAKANDNSVVHLADAETITGNKTFQNGLKVGGNSGVNQIGLWNADTEQYDYIYGGIDGGDFAFPSTDKLGISTELKLNGELTGNVLGKLPSFEINTNNTKVIEFINNHDLNDKPFIFIEQNSPWLAFMDINGNNLTYSMFSIDGPVLFSDVIAIDSNTKFSDLFTDEYTFEFGNNKVTVISALSTDMQYPSAKAVYDLVQAIKRNAFTPVDIATYPTLNDFLASTGEEGYLYLYPVDTSDLTKGYKQYIWENSAWVYLGDTQLDLTNYPRKDQNETITGEWTFNGQVKFGSNAYVEIGSNNQLEFGFPSSKFQIYNNEIRVDAPRLRPQTNNTSDLGSSTNNWKDLYLSGTYYHTNYRLVYDSAYSQIRIANGSGDLKYALGLSTENDATKRAFYSYDNNSLGTSNYKWNNLYLSGGFNPNTNGYKLTLPDTANFTANSELVDTASDQTITGAKTFNSNIRIGTTGSTYKKNIIFSGSNYLRDIYFKQNEYYLDIFAKGSSQGKVLRIYNGSDASIILYNQANANYGLTIPNTIEWTANKVIATTDQAFNVINASDIVSNTLTQAQYDLITNGKPTRIVGTLTGENIENTLLVSQNEDTTYFKYFLLARKSSVNVLGTFRVNKSTKIISASYNIEINNGGDFSKINGKTIPAYPTTNSVPQVLTIGANGGNLSWQNNLPQWYGTQADYDQLTPDSNTMYFIEE